MHILIGQAYHLRLDPKNWRSLELFPPLGSLYAASVLREAGHDIRFSDSMIAEDTDVWVSALDAGPVELALLYEDNFNYLTKMCLLNMRDAAERMIGAAKARGATVVVAGSDASDVPATYLEFGADVVINGEGEATLEALVAHLSGRDSSPDGLSGIEGITFRAPNGQIVKTPKRRVMRNIDDLPAPAWDLVNLDRYRTMRAARGIPFELNVATSRGCPFHCNWCAKPIWGRVYNARSPEQIADEFRTLKDLSNPDRIWVMDDIFAMKPRWAGAFADALDERGAHIPFKCLSRADLLLRPGEVEALARAGCDELWIGAESGSQKILDAMEKGTSLQQIHDAAMLLRAHGIKVGYFLQYGYPGETWADIKATFAMLRQDMPDVIGISVSYPLPGTPFHERVAKELGAKKNWDHADDLDMMYQGPFNTAFYRILHRYTHRLRRYYRGVQNPVRRRDNGAVDLVATVREALGTVRAVANMAVLWPQLHWQRMRSRSGIAALEPTLNRAEAGLENIDLDSGR